jgi:dihydroxyacetone kinase-like predicted kinase
MSITHMDGTLLKHAVIAGAQRVIQMQEQLNNINVFPVADSDTGTNMSLTLRSVAEGALNCKESSIDEMSIALADATLMGAHGSSGSILAQFFQGWPKDFEAAIDPIRLVSQERPGTGPTSHARRSPNREKEPS